MIWGHPIDTIEFYSWDACTRAGEQILQKYHTRTQRDSFLCLDKGENTEKEVPREKGDSPLK